MTITRRVIIMSDITQEKVKHLFDYHKSGSLVRKIYTSSNARVGSFVGCEGAEGYKLVRVDGKLYRVHRLIFLWHHGFLPEYVDHIDTDVINNKIENLRRCSKSQNSCNGKMRINNTSGIKGVSWNKEKSKWMAKLCHKRKQMHIGYFSSIHEAEKAVRAARKKLHGEFANDGLNNQR